jgi:hypothetical protein
LQINALIFSRVPKTTQVRENTRFHGAHGGRTFAPIGPRGPDPPTAPAISQPDQPVAGGKPGSGHRWPEKAAIALLWLFVPAAAERDPGEHARFGVRRGRSTRQRTAAGLVMDTVRCPERFPRPLRDRALRDQVRPPGPRHRRRLRRGECRSRQSAALLG